MTPAAGGAPSRETPTAFSALGAAAIAVPVAIVAALPGLVFAAGFDHLAYLLGAMAGIVLAGVWIAPKLAALGARSLTEALRIRFGPLTARLAAIVIVLALLPILVAEFSVAGVLLGNATGLPMWVGLGLLLLLALAGALMLDARRLGWLTLLGFGALTFGLGAPLAALCVKHGGLPFLAPGFGPSLPDIATLEETILQSGRVDFDTFGAHTATFLKLSPLDFSALVVSLAMGLAVLPPLLAALQGGGVRPARVRLGGAWVALWAMLVLGSIPALAAYAKLDIYAALTKPTPLAQPPSWVEAPSRAGLVHLHGTSAALLDAVATEVKAGHAETAAVAESLAHRFHALESRWSALDEAVKAAMIEAARTLPDADDPAALWTAYTNMILPAAASAAGADDPNLTQSALAIEPLGLLVALPALAGLPDGLGIAVVVAMALAALVMIVALLRTVLTLGTARPDGRTSWPMRAGTASMAIVAAGFAALEPTETTAMAVSGLSLAAAGLFPVSALGLSWMRVTRVAASAAIVAGAALSLYYDVGIQVFPAAFYKTWPALSDAGETAIEEFNLLDEAVRDAADDDARAEAQTALDDWARGTPTLPGLANWAGLDAASSAAIAVPLGLVTLVLVSLVTRPPRREDDQP